MARGNASAWGGRHVLAMMVLVALTGVAAASVSMALRPDLTWRSRFFEPSATTVTPGALAGAEPMPTAGSLPPLALPAPPAEPREGPALAPAPGRPWHAKPPTTTTAPARPAPSRSTPRLAPPAPVPTVTTSAPVPAAVTVPPLVPLPAPPEPPVQPAAVPEPVTVPDPPPVEVPVPEVPPVDTTTTTDPPPTTTTTTTTTLPCIPIDILTCPPDS